MPTRPELLGQAFCELLERYPADRLPKAGGTSATVTVLLDHDQLTTGRLTCHTGIIPVVYAKALAGPR